MIDSKPVATRMPDATALSRLFEIGVFYGLRRSLTPALHWLGRMSTVLPALPIAKISYLGFLTSVAVAVWLKCRGEKLSDYGPIMPRFKSLA
jgi:hypothetical protein